MASYYEPERRGLYRSNNGMILGVCAGIAEYFDLSVFWTRVIAVGLLLCTGFFPVGLLYILGGFLMKKDPYEPYDEYY